MSGDGFTAMTIRNDISRDIISGFAAVTPTLAGAWRLIDAALADLPIALAELGRARAELEAVRLDRANLPQGRRWGRYRPGHSPAARGSETPCQPFRKPRTSLSL